MNKTKKVDVDQWRSLLFYKPRRKEMEAHPSRRCTVCYYPLPAGWPMKYCPDCWDTAKWQKYYTENQ